jgi:hypothetical protein
MSRRIVSSNGSPRDFTGVQNADRDAENALRMNGALKIVLVHEACATRRPNRDALFEYGEFVCYGAKPKA